MIPSIAARISPSASTLRIGSMRLEAGQDVADVALFEEAQRQADQVVEQPRAHVEVQRVLHDQGDMRPQRQRRHVDGGEQPESERESEHQPDVAARHDFIDRDLHVERRSDDEQLQDHRQDEDLDQRRSPRRSSVPRRSGTAAGPFHSCGVKPAAGDSSSATPVRCFEAASSEYVWTPTSRVVNDDPLARYRLENHEVVHVPVHDRRQRQATHVVQFEAQAAGTTDASGWRSE